MNGIERKMMDAVMNGKNWHSANTEVHTSGNKTYVRLHGYLIGIYDRVKRTWRYSDAAVTREGDECGTHTTMSRLNAMGANLCRRKGVWYHAGTKRPFVNDFLEGEGGEVHYNRHKRCYEVW